MTTWLRFRKKKNEMCFSKFLFVLALWSVTVLGALGLSGCSLFQQGQRLRIVNSSPNAITNLRVLFPEEEISFGNVGPNATTDYKVFPKGVYGYAAYRYDLNGQTVTQPVIDWVGESPIEGSAFTYTLTFDPNNPNFQRIELTNVTRDQ
jgi:hypothetical protein